MMPTVPAEVLEVQFILLLTPWLVRELLPLTEEQEEMMVRMVVEEQEEELPFIILVLIHLIFQLQPAAVPAIKPADKEPSV